MANLLYNISQVLGITIIHSLWQGLLIYLVLRVLLLSIPALSSVKKYNLSILALLSIALCFIYTFCHEVQAYDWHPVVTAHSSFFLGTLSFPAHQVSYNDYKATLYPLIKSYLPYISVLYAIGLIINLGKLGIAWNKIRVIKKGMILAENLQQQIDDISKQLNIRKRVQVSFSRLVDVPCAIGYFKPILLLPITLTFKLSAEEIEAILLHELSHIKKNDYLVNILQQIIAVLLFFNPFAQLINGIISTEREHRCDDMVVETTASPLTYAYALLKLEEARQINLKLALAATQNKQYLLTRIERIMKTKKPIGNIRAILIAVIILTGSLSSIAWLNPEIKNGKVTFKNIAHTAAVLKPTTIATPKIIVVKQHKNKPVEVNDGVDTTHNTQFNDTTKKKIKIIVEDENGKREYNSVNEMPEKVKHIFYEENGDVILDSNYTRYKNFYNSPKWKKQVEDMQLQAMAMAKKINSPEFKKQIEAMKLQGEKMKQYYDSPEWKKKVEDMKIQGEKMKEYYDRPEVKKQLEDMKLQGEKMGEYYNSPEFKKQIEQMAKQGEELGKDYVNSPEFKKMQSDIVKQSLDMAKQFSDVNFNSDDNYIRHDNSDVRSRAKVLIEKEPKIKKVERKEKVEKKKNLSSPKSVK